MTKRQLDITKPMVDITVSEGNLVTGPLYKATYVDGTWVKFRVEVVDESPATDENQHSVEKFVNSNASSGRVELDDASMTESRRMNCKDCP